MRWRTASRSSFCKLDTSGRRLIPSSRASASPTPACCLGCSPRLGCAPSSYSRRRPRRRRCRRRAVQAVAAPAATGALQLPCRWMPRSRGKQSTRLDPCFFRQTRVYARRLHALPCHLHQIHSLRLRHLPRRRHLLRVPRHHHHHRHHALRHRHRRPRCRPLRHPQSWPRRRPPRRR